MGGFIFEKEAINFYHEIKKISFKNPGNWQHSDVQKRPVRIFSVLSEERITNFRRTQLARGFIGFPDIPLNTEEDWLNGLSLSQKIRGTANILWLLNRLRKRIDFKLNDIKDNLVGNPCTYRFWGTKFTETSIRNYYYCMRSIENITPSEPLNIIEIGGGFGALCEKLINSKNVNIRNYIFVELPESMMLAYYYLKNSGVNVIIYKGQKLPENTKTVILLPPWLLKDFKMKIDLLINTMSFHHMDIKNLKYYFSNIDRLKIKKMYLVNRKLKRDKSDVKFNDYPIPKSYKLEKEAIFPFAVKENWLERVYIRKSR